MKPLTYRSLVTSLLGSLALAAAASAQTSYVEKLAVTSEANYGSNCGLGHAVDVDGDTAVVGVPYPNAGSQSGRVLVYRKVGGVWTQQADLTGTDYASSLYLGASVAIDGDVLVAGAPTSYHLGTKPSAGAAYVYTRVGTTWSAGVRLYASDPLQGAEFGHSVTIDGSTIVVGAPQATYGIDGGRGAAYVFEFNGTSWVQTAKLAGVQSVAGARNGSSVAIDGDRLVIGARTMWEDGGFTIGTGAAYVFVRNGGSWSQEAKLQSSSYMAWGLLGSSASIEGTRVVVGAEGENFNTGAAYVFEKSGASWVQVARLVGASTNASDYFGRGVDVSGDRIVVGAPNYDSSTPAGNGAVKLYEWNGAQWTEELELLGLSMDDGDTLGGAAAIDGDTVVGGSPSVAQGLFGKAWIWDVDPDAVESYCVAKVNTLGCTPAIGWSGSASASSPQPFLITASQVLSQKPGLLFYGFNPNNIPFQGGTMCVKAPVKRTNVLNAGGNPPTDCSGTYSYDFNALIQSGSEPLLVPGAVVYCQYWYRDPQDAHTTGFSNALRCRIDP